MIRIVTISLLILVLTFQNGIAQTKKIANASHHSYGPTFNWTSSDNLGEIRDYDKIRRYEVAIDSIVVDSITPDSVVVIETTVNDTIVENKALCQPRDSAKVMKLKTKTRKKNERKKANKPTNQKPETGMLKEEVIPINQNTRQPQKKADMSWWFLLLLFPVGYLMIKKG